MIESSDGRYHYFIAWRAQNGNMVKKGHHVVATHDTIQMTDDNCQKLDDICDFLSPGIGWHVILTAVTPLARPKY